MSPCVWCDTLADCGTCLPRLAWEGRTPTEPAECWTCLEAAHLLGLGESGHTTARALRITITSLDRHLRRHNRRDLLALIGQELTAA